MEETMTDLKLLTERLVEKEKAAISKRVEEANKQVKDEIQAFEAEEMQRKQQLIEEIRVKTKREYEIKKNTLEIQRRNDLLSAKQTVLNKVFRDAKEKLDHIDSKTFQSFALSVLNHFDSGSELTLTLGQKSADMIDSSWLSQHASGNVTVHLSEQTIPNKSGLIVEKEGIDYNFLFDSLVEDMKAEMLSQISNELF